MTPPSVETTIKLILTDRSFNIPQFINQELTVFLTQIRSYLPSVQRTIWGNKYANAKGVIDALSRVFDFTTSNDFIPEIIVQLNMIFCHLFHPESSKLIRKPAISLLFKVVFLLDEDLISGIDGVFPLTVAFNCFARSDSERDIFYRPIPSGISPVIDSNSSPSNVEDAISALKLVFSNIIDNWNMKKHVCSHILFRCILSIIFPEIYDKMKVSNCGFSFISPAPSLLRYEINNFIVNFFSNGCDIDQLFATGTNLSFIQYFYYCYGIVYNHE
ncbi:hypothetical protein TRFO_38224 [Tritrichomonas foetus]|uniref:Uncharacterized protein n=1 Tax=Tritrichomonas foetus TaxID=1144522 RepID=A0A1J4J8Z8_9EUKA|nr:hypothetical protein TRFO_38224 [Tritrichomonas foetus]|eukprot:OHS95654.1 hypothetical protein TRFO_38224 [Tritrichomonas foetus]